MKKKTSGFTLVEIMIVVMIIGLLAAIAVPSFLKAREASQTNACINNLRQIDGAKDVWAIDTKQPPDASEPAFSVLVPDYLKAEPECPAGGSYTIGNLSTTPSCNINGHELPGNS